MQHQLTLQQFEQIDGLLSALRFRPSLEALIAQSARRAEVTDCYFRPEWRLLDACVEAIGLEAALGYPSTEECASAIVLGALLTDVVDEAA